MMNDVKTVSLPTIIDTRGSLSFFEAEHHIPFPIARVSWLYSTYAEAKIGGLADNKGQQFFVALSGIFEIDTDCSGTKATYLLDKANHGLILPPHCGRVLQGFSSDAVALVVDSEGGRKPGKPEQFDSSASSVQECELVELNEKTLAQGSAVMLEQGRGVPFEIQRIYYLYDVPMGALRGGHGHRDLKQLIIAVHGSFKVILDDGKEKNVFELKRPNEGLLVVPGIWRVLTDFSADAVCLVLASIDYDEKDYFREYQDFLKFKGRLSNDSR